MTKLGIFQTDDNDHPLLFTYILIRERHHVLLLHSYQQTDFGMFGVFGMQDDKSAFHHF